MDALPEFAEHPDPIAHGVVEASDATREVCGKARGAIYTGPQLREGVPCGDGPCGDGEEAPDPLAVCPWCIADGRAAAERGLAFVRDEAVGGFGEWDPVPPEVVDRIARHTPAFRGWQAERWFTCCGDAAVFLGPAGWRDVQRAGASAVAALQRESGFEGEDWEDYFAEMERDGEVRGYLFQCRHCERFGGYSDCR